MGVWNTLGSRCTNVAGSPGKVLHEKSLSIAEIKNVNYSYIEYVYRISITYTPQKAVWVPLCDW